MTQELSRHERAVVAEFGIHPEDTTPAAEARRHGWSAGTRLHGGPIRALAAEAERDALAAVIEKAKRLVPIDTAAAYDALDTAPADVLREHDAEVWDAGYWAAQGDAYVTPSGTLHRMQPVNPYRTEKPEES